MLDIDKLILNKEFNPVREVSLPCDKKGSCNGDCCGNIPLTKEFIETMWKKYKLTSKLGKFKKAKYIKSQIPSTRMYHNKNNMCIFQYNGKCLIYNDRPGICKAYGETHLVRCPYENLDKQPSEPNRSILVNENNKLREQMMLDTYIKFSKNSNLDNILNK